MGVNKNNKNFSVFIITFAKFACALLWKSD